MLPLESAPFIATEKLTLSALLSAFEPSGKRLASHNQKLNMIIGSFLTIWSSLNAEVTPFKFKNINGSSPNWLVKIFYLIEKRR